MSDTAYLSFIDQTLHYFNRPHEQAINAPVSCTAAWKGNELPPLEQMAYRLSEGEVEELINAVEVAQSLGRPTKELTSEDFPMPLLSARVAGWR